VKQPTLTGDALIVVAHPDDEVLWAGGLILMHRSVTWTILALCRKSDPDRNPKFFRVAGELGAQGIMGDMDDGPEQHPLPSSDVERMILSLLPQRSFDLVVSHSPVGEYTRHRRHEETSNAVQALWRRGELSSPELWLFAYEDGGGTGDPQPIPDAHRLVSLDGPTHLEKMRLITDVYGFSRDGFEGRAVSSVEAFWTFTTVTELDDWLKQRGVTDENSPAL
jgi:LmbE family N-acetylglucosaminyl deacetylase